MHCRLLPGVMSIVLVGCPAAFSAEVDAGWKLAVRDKDVEIYSRPHAASPLKGYKAVGPIEAPTYAVCAVIDDFQNYPKFMPSGCVCQIIKRSGGSIVGIQRLPPKV